jgi:putative ABC transport system permease protein
MFWIFGQCLSSTPLLSAGLGDGARITAGSGRLRRWLVGAEVALAVVLLVGAALTLRSFVTLVSVRPSFPVSGLVTARMSLPGIRYGDPGKSAQFFETLSARLRDAPGVIAAGAASRLPLGGNEWTGQLFIDGRPEVHGREIRHKTVTMGYLETLGTRVIAGRVFAGPDVLNGQRPIVINDALARQYFPGGGAVGARIAQSEPGPKTQWNTVIGVVADEPQDGLGVPSQPEIYDPELLSDDSEMAVLVRSSLPPQDAIALLRKIARESDSQVALFNVRSMDEGLWRSVARERLAMSLAMMFAISALLLAAVGIYGVASHSVAQRTREIGVRVAFGATHVDVVSMLLRQELSVVAAGLAAGAIAAFLMARLVSAMLFRTTATDWPSYAAGAALILVSAFAACIVPARRALRVDPIVALRND